MNPNIFSAAATTITHIFCNRHTFCKLQKKIISYYLGRWGRRTEHEDDGDNLSKLTKICGSNTKKMQIIGPAKGLQFSYRVFYIHDNLYLNLGWLKKVV